MASIVATAGPALDTGSRIRQALRSRKGAVVAALLVGGGTAYFLQQHAAAKKRAARRKKEAADGKVVVRSTRRNPQKSMRAMLGVLTKVGGSKLWSLLAIAIVRTAISNRLSRVSGDLFHACFRKKMPWFVRLMTEHVIITLCSSGLEATRQRVITSLALRWREHLTRKIHDGYFKNMAYYRLSHVDRRVNNPEQIVCEDIPKFVNQLAEIAGEYVTGLTDTLYFSVRLVSYMHSPRYLFYLLAYIVGTGTLTTAVSPPFGRIYKKSQTLEGDYRKLQTRLFSNAEPVALLGGVGMEASNINRAFRELVKHTAGVQGLQWKFGMFQDFFLKYLGATFAVVLILGPYFGGHLQPDNSTHGRAKMLSHMRYHTGVIINLFAGLGILAVSPQKLFKLSAYADRIKEMQEVVKEINEDAARNEHARPQEQHVVAADEIRFEDCTVVTPANATLVEGLSLSVKPGTNLLVTGPNGSGKSSLFRVLGGLWPLTKGRVHKPGGLNASGLAKEIFYVPQRPYVALGTLREQIVYPLSSGDVASLLPDDKLRELLAAVDLEYLLERRGGADEREDWGAVLSLGEQQRLGMARLFFHRPTFAILDECTSGVTMDMEERFCARVREIGCTCVTISHRPALVAFHDLVLALDGEGGWSVHKGMREKQGAPPPSSAGLLEGGGGGATTAAGKVRAQDSLANTLAFTQREAEEESMKDHLGAVLGKAPEAGAYPPPPPRRHAVEFGKVHSSKWRSVLRVIDPLSTPQMLWVPLVVCCRTALSDRIASLNGESVKFVLRQDRDAFVRLIGRSIAQSAANAVCAPSLKYLTDALALSWRARLTKRLCKLYLADTNFYSVAQLEGVADADQRLTRDVERLSKELADLVPNMVKPIVDILWFSSRAYMLTGRRGLIILYLYMLFGVGALRMVTPDFGKLLGDEQSLEGVFRFVHSRLRTHAESIAFFGGGDRENKNVEGEFKTLMAHSRVVLLKRWVFDICDQFLTKQLPHNVTWGMSMMYSMSHRGQYDSTKVQGELVHDLRYLASMVSWSFVAFGDVLGLHKRFAELSGGVGRVAGLLEALEGVASARSSGNAGAPAPPTPPAGAHPSRAAEAGCVTFQGADIVTPTNRVLCRALSLTIRPRANLLVTGPNGCGKSSIFRVSSNLWPLLRGRVRLPDGDNQIMYVPQKPYMAVGSLREQVTYPQPGDEAARLHGGKAALDESLLRLLGMVKLGYLLEREGGWDVKESWEERLSLGEQQRLGMARLFFHRPKFAVLDECTNATSVDIEQQLYQQAQDLGITIVTVSQRPALVKYHTSELRLLDGEGDWELRRITFK